MKGSQPDLFSRQEADHVEPPPLVLEEPPADFIERIRAELGRTLQTARRASSLPWSDLTSATLAELRFHSIAAWLPEQEAEALRTAFGQEMERIYAQTDPVANSSSNE